MDVAVSATAEFAPAKINLALHVTGRRADGFHLLESLVVFAAAGDRVTVEAAAEDWFSVAGPFAESVPTDDGNLVVRARDSLRRYIEDRRSTAPPSVLPDIPPTRGEIGGFTTAASSALLAIGENRAAAVISPRVGEMSGRTEGGAKERAVSPFPVSAHLEKNLPVASGIGGGSSDAAAVLRALNRLWDIDLTPAELAHIGRQLGADVPMCLHARPLIARGIGEEIEALDGLPPLHMVLVNPGVPVSTPAVFGALASRTNPPLPRLPSRPDFRTLAGWLAATRNDLETPAIAVAPPVADALAALRATGAAIARMSGSGATCFGLYPTPGAAETAAKSIRRAGPRWFVAATQSTDPP